jgi:hypothetical protein
MDSPYKPGAGVMPPLLAGRDTERSRALEQLIRTEQFQSPGRSPLILTGVRGVGKTVMLRSIINEARNRRFVTAHVTAVRRGALAPQLAAAIAEQIALTDRSRTGARWERFAQRLGRLSIQISLAGVVTIGRPASTAAIDHDLLIGVLGDGAQLALDHGHPGLLVAIDELQEGSDNDLAQLTTAAQQLTDAALVIIGAGLPHTPDRLMSAGSFAERFGYQELRPLFPADAAAALLVPAQAAGVLWEHSAADLVLSTAQGSPFLLQMYADAAWRHANPDTDRNITLAHADMGLAEADVELQTGLFRGRWNRASPAEQEFLIAMASVGVTGAAQISLVAAALGRTVTEISYLRSRLLDKGLISAPARGKVSFTIPGFDRFVLQQTH